MPEKTVQSPQIFIYSQEFCMKMLQKQAMFCQKAPWKKAVALLKAVQKHVTLPADVVGLLPKDRLLTKVKGIIRLNGEEKNGLEEFSRKRALLKLQMIHDGKDINKSNMARSEGDVLSSPESGRVLFHHKNEKHIQCKETPEVKADFSNGKADQFGTSEFSWIDDIPSCPVFYPTKEEFEDPSAYLQAIAPIASKHGHWSEW